MNAMTDTPAEVAEALNAISAASYALPEDGAANLLRDVDTTRAHIADLQSQLAAQRERDGRDALLQAIHDEKQEWVGDFRRPVHKALDDLLAKFDAALKEPKS